MPNYYRNSASGKNTGSYSGSAYGSYSGYGKSSSFGKTTSTSTGSNSSSRFGTTSRSGSTSSAFSSSKFSNFRKEVQARIGSYQALCKQCNGAGSVTAFSPTNANKWLKWVSTGTRVYTFTNTQFTRFFGTSWNKSTSTNASTTNSTSPTQVTKFLRGKFGTGIKAVTRGKGGTWLVAASPSVSARPFANYNWK